MKRVIAAFAAICLTPALALASEINLNAADAEALQALDGVGESRASAIIEYREANGRFATVEDFTSVPGVGAATLEANRERLTVE